LGTYFDILLCIKFFYLFIFYETLPSCNTRHLAQKLAIFDFKPLKKNHLRMVNTLSSQVSAGVMIFIGFSLVTSFKHSFIA